MEYIIIMEPDFVSFGGIGHPKVANSIRGVSKANPMGRYFHYQSDYSFGNIAPYTGY